ncbi:integrase, catalytic region, zinc finger, CCHC-type containing protein [Tanacetum coccineum]
MSNMSEDIWYAGSDTRPPMLDRTDFESWQQRIRLYCLGKDNGENIMKSITEGPFQMGTFIQTPAEDAEETEGALQLGPERARVFTDLSAEEKERYKADIRATNILLQGIPKDIYTLINHYTDAKDIWDNVKMILEGSELTKDDRESQLYDEFERFRQIKGETIHVYYVRFSKLINDMRNIKMTMSRMQLNSKFVNNMLPEWSRFITEVKLNRGLKESNFDQLYAYLKQHEVHANENRMMMERFIQPTNDPLALVSNASIQQDDHFRGTMQEEIQELGMQEDKMLLMQAQENEQFGLNVESFFLEADQLDAFDSDVDEAPTTHTMFMANLTSEDPIFNEVGTSYDSDIPFEVQDHDNYHDSVYGHHDVHEMQNNIQQDYVVDSEADYTSDSNIISYDQYVEDNAEHVVQSNVSSVQNDALRSIIDEMHEEGVQSRIVNKQDRVVKDSIEVLNWRDIRTVEEKPSSQLQNEKSNANCLSNQLLFDVEQSRCLDLEAEISKLQNENQKDVNDEMIRASGSKPRSNTKNNRYLPAKSVNQKTVEDHPRTNKSVWTKVNGVDSSAKRVWKATGKLFANVGYQWRPTGKKFSLGKFNCGYQWRPTGKKFVLGEQCPVGQVPLIYDGLRAVQNYTSERNLDTKLFSVGQFCDSDREIAFRKAFLLLCLLSKASKIKSWLWHCRLNNLNFGPINDLARKDLVFKIKGMKLPEFVINFIKQIQVGLNKTVRYIRTDNGMEFVNQVMSKYYEGVGIFHQKSVSRTPQQNSLSKDRNRTRCEAARTMLIFSKAPMFLWAEAVATACYTHNRSLIHTRHNKTPYELVHDNKPDLSFLRVFGAIGYPTNDSEDLGKLQAKADIGIFVGYAPSRKGF